MIKWVCVGIPVPKGGDLFIYLFFKGRASVGFAGTRESAVSDMSSAGEWDETLEQEGGMSMVWWVGHVHSHIHIWRTKIAADVGRCKWWRQQFCWQNRLSCVMGEVKQERLVLLPLGWFPGEIKGSLQGSVGFSGWKFKRVVQWQIQMNLEGCDRCWPSERLWQWNQDQAEQMHWYWEWIQPLVIQWIPCFVSAPTISLALF